MLVEHTLHVQPEGYQEPYNEGLKAHPRPSPCVGFELRTFQVCVLRIIQESAYRCEK